MSRYIDKDKTLYNLNLFAPEPYKGYIADFIEKQQEIEVIDIINDTIKEFADELMEICKQDGAYGYVDLFDIDRLAKQKIHERKLRLLKK